MYSIVLYVQYCFQCSVLFIIQKVRKTQNKMFLQQLKTQSRMTSQPNLDPFSFCAVILRPEVKFCLFEHKYRTKNPNKKFCVSKCMKKATSDIIRHFNYIMHLSMLSLNKESVGWESGQKIIIMIIIIIIIIIINLNLYSTHIHKNPRCFISLNENFESKCAIPEDFYDLIFR